MRLLILEKKYNLSQVDFSRLLGLGDVTITRYEIKAIQDETYDSILRNLPSHPGDFDNSPATPNSLPVFNSRELDGYRLLSI